MTDFNWLAANLIAATILGGCGLGFVIHSVWSNARDKREKLAARDLSLRVTRIVLEALKELEAQLREQLKEAERFDEQDKRVSRLEENQHDQGVGMNNMNDHLERVDERLTLVEDDLREEAA